MFLIKDENDWACSMHGTDEKCKQNISQVNWKEKTSWKT